MDHAVYARFAVLAALIGLLLWQERRRTPEAAADGTPKENEKAVALDPR